MRTASGGELLGSLDLLRRRRQPYADLIAEIVAATLDRWPPLAGLPLVEIGSGTGQLREWLPAPLRERMIHTDPSEPALRALRERAPQARTRTAGAEQLPFADASTAAVMGLCVFDAIAEAAHPRVVAEVERVLAPGGHFIHFADMATLLEGPFDKLVGAGLCPIPNVFGDPGDYSLAPGHPPHQAGLVVRAGRHLTPARASVATRVEWLLLRFSRADVRRPERDQGFPRAGRQHRTTPRPTVTPGIGRPGIVRGRLSAHRAPALSFRPLPRKLARQQLSAQWIIPRGRLRNRHPFALGSAAGRRRAALP